MVAGESKSILESEAYTTYPLLEKYFGSYLETKLETERAEQEADEMKAGGAEEGGCDRR